MPFSAEIIAKELCNKWGIDSTNVASITIKLNPNSVANAIIEYYPTSDEIAIFKTYEIKEKEED